MSSEYEGSAAMLELEPWKRIEELYPGEEGLEEDDDDEMVEEEEEREERLKNLEKEGILSLGGWELIVKVVLDGSVVEEWRRG